MFNKVLVDTYKYLKTQAILLGTIAQPVYTKDSASGTQKQLIFKRLDTVGDGTGVYDMSVDASASSVTYLVKPPAGEVWRVSAMLLYVQDSKGFDVDKWGNGITLTNGMMPRIKLNGSVFDLLQAPIMNSGDIGSLSEAMTLHTFGSADDILTARWNFSKTGQYVRLIGDDADELQIYLNDNYSGLSLQYIGIEGYKE